MVVKLDETMVVNMILSEATSEKCDIHDIERGYGQSCECDIERGKKCRCNVDKHLYVDSGCASLKLQKKFKIFESSEFSNSK